MSKKLFFLISLLILTAILLVGCGGGEATESDCGKEDVLCVGLMTDVGEVDDKSFNQSAWEGVNLARL